MACSLSSATPSPFSFSPHHPHPHLATPACNKTHCSHDLFRFRLQLLAALSIFGQPLANKVGAAYTLGHKCIHRHPARGAQEDSRPGQAAGPGISHNLFFTPTHLGPEHEWLAGIEQEQESKIPVLPAMQDALAKSWLARTPHFWDSPVWPERVPARAGTWRSLTSGPSF